MKKQNVNKHGLQRVIDASIKREIRQKCGFGCVKCGNAVYQYEHVDPEFNDAKEHNPNHIVLLCGGCHDLVSRGLLSKDTIKTLALNPKCKQTGFSFGPFDIGTETPEIIVGTYRCKNVKTLISVDGESILSVNPPESETAPFSISAVMRDKEGNELLRIENNEWKSTSNNWDVEVVGRTITIRKKIGDIALIIRADPPNKLTIARMEMEYNGVKISCKENDNIAITTPNGTMLYTSGMSVVNYEIGLNIRENGFDLPSGGGLGSSVSMDYFKVGEQK